MIPTPLQPMAAYKQFILWQEKPGKTPGRMEKIPVDAAGNTISAHNAAAWMTGADAYSIAASTGFKVGFVFTAADPFFFVDIDHCKNPDGTWSDLATQVVSCFPGAAVEISNSGEGLHIFGMGAHAAGDGHRCKNQGLGLEFYTAGRFVAFGMRGGETGNAGTDHSGMVPAFINHFLPGDSSAGTLKGWTAAPVPEWNGPTDDGELLDLMFKSRQSAGSVFGSKASIVDLWTANEAALSAAFPHPDGTAPFDHSSADAALLSHLAFWTGKDCARMDRLFRMSGLMRDKWDQRTDYRARSCTGSVSRCSAVYSKGAKKDQPPATPVDATPTMQAVVAREGFQYLGIAQQLEHFKGCVYVRNVHRVFTPDGELLKPEVFKTTYGGYVFQLDSDGNSTTKNAFEAFTESQGVHFPKVHATCFRPETGSGNMISDEGRLLVNTYIPTLTHSVEGDVEPFLEFMRKLLPVENDRDILTAYLGAMVQFPGVKFQWAPILQGCEGNGKSLIISAIARCVGEKYTHLPNAADLAGNGAKFNAWIQGKMFIGVEEIYVADRREAEDALKPLITNTRIESQGKGADQVMIDNRANFILNSNHKDAIMKRKGDRRYGIFFTAQQQPEDLKRDGMDGAYFPDLYRWFRNGGAAAINHYLRTMQIPDELNPATHCHRAPFTSSTASAISSSVGVVEQDVLEAVNEGRLGFCGGFISSIQLDVMMKTGRIRKISQQKRRELLESLGYIPHPALQDGRANNPIIIDGGKPRLFVKADHPAAQLPNAKAVADAYVRAQETDGQDHSHAAAIFHTPARLQ